MAAYTGNKGNAIYIPGMEACTDCDAMRDAVDRLEDSVSGVQASLENKVDKVSGKGLSANDYTDTEKIKLSGIAAGAEKNRTYTVFTGKPTGNQTPGFGATFTVSQIKQSADGQVSGTDRTVKIPDTLATTTAPGLMSAADKKSLDGILTRLAQIETAVSSALQRVDEMESEVSDISRAVSDIKTAIGNKSDIEIAKTDADGNTVTLTVLAEMN